MTSLFEAERHELLQALAWDAAAGVIDALGHLAHAGTAELTIDFEPLLADLADRSAGKTCTAPTRAG